MTTKCYAYAYSSGFKVKVALFFPSSNRKGIHTSSNEPAIYIGYRDIPVSYDHAAHVVASMNAVYSS